jgi:uncharacterized YigZ family protein
MEIKTILNEVENLIVIEKSKFLGYLFPCDSKEMANEILLDMRKKHEFATHVCYAYIINDDNVILYKSSDDGEPSQTAGAPILNVIKRNNLTNVLCIVVRYFGGIKLGAGGLVRAYSNSAVEVVNKATVVTLVDAFKGKITFPYDKINFIDKYFETNNIEIVNKEYDLEVSYTVITYNQDDVSNIMNKISYLNVKYSDLGIIQTRNK